MVLWEHMEEEVVQLLMDLKRDEGPDISFKGRPSVTYFLQLDPIC
jgi:hypothetical protein